MPRHSVSFAQSLCYATRRACCQFHLDSRETGELRCQAVWLVHNCKWNPWQAQAAHLPEEAPQQAVDPAPAVADVKWSRPALAPAQPAALAAHCQSGLAYPPSPLHALPDNGQCRTHNCSTGLSVSECLMLTEWVCRLQSSHKPSGECLAKCCVSETNLIWLTDTWLHIKDYDT